MAAIFGFIKVFTVCVLLEIVTQSAKRSPTFHKEPQKKQKKTDHPMIMSAYT